ncbi:MAG: cyclic nucleotide-binding domain-containing protein [Thermoleophilia bacterium]|nr:cyclic nucleotide-binding domain-containing protein [Thermoleophilia bacterium]
MDPSQLKRFSLFEGVEDEKLAKIAVFTQIVEFPEGKVIIEEGGYANDFYAIEEGTVQVTKAGEKVATLGAGDVFGEQGLLERQERSASVIAETVVRALKIEHWELSRMRKAMPEVVENLLKTVQSRD